MSVENRTTAVKNVVIMIAAGRDFHNFNLAFRNNPGTEWLPLRLPRFPTLRGDRIPRRWRGALYPDGILILPEEDLDREPSGSQDGENVTIVQESASELRHHATLIVVRQ